MIALKDIEVFLGFDLETTGIDVDNDRIVTASLSFYNTSCEEPWTFYDFLINPGIEIPQGAINVHGITNEKAATGQEPKKALIEIKSTIEKAWEDGIPLVGHNIGSYDINLLNSELVRHGLEALDITGPILDTMVLFRMFVQKKATLAIVAEKFGIVNENAHEAKSDVITSVSALTEMIKRYPSLGEASTQDIWTRQRVAQRTWANGMRTFFASINKPFDNDGSFPVKDKWVKK